MDRENAVCFTVRETEVLRKLCRGMSNKSIAYELNMAESTVKVHIGNIMRKLGARNRTEIVVRVNGYLAE